MKYTHCKFCINKLLNEYGFCCDPCPYNYVSSTKINGDGWDFYAGKYWVDVYSTFSIIYENPFGLGKPELRRAARPLVGTLNEIIAVRIQIFPDAGEETIDTIIAFS